MINQSTFNDLVQNINMSKAASRNATVNHLDKNNIIIHFFVMKDTQYYCRDTEDPLTALSTLTVQWRFFIKFPKVSWKADSQ